MQLSSSLGRAFTGDEGIDRAFTGDEGIDSAHANDVCHCNTVVLHYQYYQ